VDAHQDRPHKSEGKKAGDPRSVPLPPRFPRTSLKLNVAREPLPPNWNALNFIQASEVFVWDHPCIGGLSALDVHMGNRACIPHVRVPHIMWNLGK
jgi:hypothetical protein